ncbi:uroporphyrinogen-III synthase [Taxawa tesnikishii (nom. ined.)]|nr:uroporphyrinogen-III synthase [Dothideales sp. JES 119]
MSSAPEGSSEQGSGNVPVLLLKTKSVPTDAYEEYFNNNTAGGSRYEPIFVPVLEHKFKEDTISWLRRVTLGTGFSNGNGTLGQTDTSAGVEHFGGIIFTSQRAVEAFTMIVNELDPEQRRSYCPANYHLLGEETGNGEALAKFMLNHYNNLPSSQTRPQDRKLPLLFMVGEQRRDIIPNTLQSLSLPEEQRIDVHEVVVYETGEMQSFASNLETLLDAHDHRGIERQWVVVFSPQGCGAMLRTLGWLNQSTGRYDASLAATQKPGTLVATIGPTTRDHLIKEFEFEPHVCAKKPSPEGVGDGFGSCVGSGK